MKSPRRFTPYNQVPKDARSARYYCTLVTNGSVCFTFICIWLILHISGVAVEENRPYPLYPLPLRWDGDSVFEEGGSRGRLSSIHLPPLHLERGKQGVLYITRLININDIL
jgi:hypothetical protein